MVWLFNLNEVVSQSPGLWWNTATLGKKSPHHSSNPNGVVSAVFLWEATPLGLGNIIH